MSRIGSGVRVSASFQKNPSQVLSYGSNEGELQPRHGGCLGVDLLPNETAKASPGPQAKLKCEILELLVTDLQQN